MTPKFPFILSCPIPPHDPFSYSRHKFISVLVSSWLLQTSRKHPNPDTFPCDKLKGMSESVMGRGTMYTRVTKEQFQIRDGVCIHTPTDAEFAPNPNSEGSMVIYTGNIGSRLVSGQLFAYAE
jgi:hypothetical protein